MQIAIVTIEDSSNTGNRLQSYALQHVLQLCRHNVITVKKNTQKKDGSIKRIAKLFLKKENGKILFKQQEDKQKDRRIEKRLEHFRAFNQKYIEILSSGNIEGLFTNELNEKYDAFFVGSDQVWNPLFWDKKSSGAEFNNYFLCFAEPNKRIAYAASFGVDAVPEQWEIPMAEELKKFKEISVREAAGAAIVKQLTGRDVPVVLDPTMLLTAEKWREIETHNLLGTEKYVLTYFLGEQPQCVLDEVEQTAWSIGAKVIHMMDLRSEYYTLGPDGFLEMVDHAQMLFTDSFHSTVFSILFHKPFRIYQRHMKDNMDMSSRIDTLLEKIGLTECAKQKRVPTKEEFTKADKLLEKEREFSLQFLRDSLQ